MKRIKTLHELATAAVNRKSVTCPKSRSCVRSPAAFILCQPGQAILHLLELGLFVYKPKNTKHTRVKFAHRSDYDCAINAELQDMKQ